MPAAQSGIVEITDCSHGLSDWYPPRLDLDRISEAWDVEFWIGAVCGRRHGSTTYKPGTIGEVEYGIFVHTPTTLTADDRLCVMLGGGAIGQVVAYTAGVVAGALLPYGVSVPVMDPTNGVDWASLHGKLFIASDSAVDRLHVYDGTTLRLAGMAPPVGAPSVANTGAGTFADARQYRVRYVETDGSNVLRRSEPSPAASFTPSGTGSAARITKPAAVNEGETNWEVEEIAANGLWYRIATVLIGTTTFDDALALASVPTSGVLSADIGDYTVPYSARYLTVDEDRLLLGGSFEDEALSGRVAWTPLGGAVGAGNDERLPADVEGFIDFDTLDGGGLTAIKAWEGKVIVFKRSQVHQMVRTSSRLRAYLPDTISRRHGAVPGSVVEGTDVDGLSCLYFLDQEVGPMQLGFKGLRVLAPQLQHTWRTQFNRSATVPASVTYHAQKRQVWWHVAINGATHPSRRWMYTVESDGTVFHTIPAPVVAATAWLEKPHLLIYGNPPWPGMAGAMVVTGDDPTAQSNYDGTLFRSYIKTRGYQLGGLLRRWEISSAVLEVGGGLAPGTVIGVTCVRDFGAETRTVSVDVAEAGLVAYRNIPIDNAYLTEGLTMQFELGDIAAISAPTWQIHGFAFTWSLGSPSTGRG